MSQPFVFESTYDPAEVQEQWMQQQASRSGAPRGDQMMIAAGIAGFILLIWPYTFALGAFILATCTFAFAMKHRSRSNVKRGSFGDLGPVHVRMTADGYSMSGSTFSSQGTWANIRGFFEAGDWIILHAWHVGRIYLSIPEMRAAGVYDQIRALAEARRAEFAERLKPAT